MIIPEYFENSIHADLCTIITEFAKQYSVAPSRESLENLVLEYCHKRRYDRTDPEHVQQILRVGKALYLADLKDKQSIIDRAQGFAKQCAMRITLLESADLLNGDANLSDDDYDRILNRFNSIRNIGSGVGSLGSETFGIMPKLNHMLNNGSSYSLSRALKTPFRSFDLSRTSKGLGPGECFYVLGATGQGKSMIKNSMGLHAAMQLSPQKRWIAHATLELSEIDNHLRYAANILNLTQEEIVADQEKFTRRITGASLAARIPTRSSSHRRGHTPGVAEGGRTARA